MWFLREYLLWYQLCIEIHTKSELKFIQKKNATNVCRWKIIRINVSKLIDVLQTIDFMKFNEHNHQRCELTNFLENQFLYVANSDKQSGRSDLFSSSFKLLLTKETNFSH